MRSLGHSVCTCRLRFLLGTGLLAVLLGASGCRSRQEPVAEAPPEAPPPDPGVVARIGDRTVRVEDLQAEVDRRQAQGRPVDSVEELLRERLYVEAMVFRAQREQLANDPDVSAELDRVLVRALRRRALSDQLDAVTVAEEDVRRTYEERIDMYTRPGVDRLAGLFLACSPQAGEARQQALQTRLHEARSKALVQVRETQDRFTPGFGKLSLDYSDDQASRYRGGDMGWFNRGTSSPRLPDAVLEAGRSLEVGEISGLLEDESGYYLVMKTDERPAQVTSFKDVQPTLRRSLLAGRREALEQAFYDDCLAQASPEIHAEALAGIILEERAGNPATPEIPPAMALLEPDQKP